MNWLLLGCTSKFGLDITVECLNQNYNVYSIGSSIVDNTNGIAVDWENINQATIEKFLRTMPTLDAVFFNQNSSALSSSSFNKNNYSLKDLWKQEKNWHQSYFVSCILPYHIVNSIKTHKETKIGWMLSSMTYDHTYKIEHADYIGNKYQNHLIMKNFSKTNSSIFFGVEPGTLNPINDNKASSLVNFISNADSSINGKVYTIDGEIDRMFDTFVGITEQDK